MYIPVPFEHASSSGTVVATLLQEPAIDVWFVSLQ